MTLWNFFLLLGLSFLHYYIALCSNTHNKLKFSHIPLTFQHQFPSVVLTYEPKQICFCMIRASSHCVMTRWNSCAARFELVFQKQIPPTYIVSTANTFHLIFEISSLDCSKPSFFDRWTQVNASDRLLCTLPCLLFRASYSRTLRSLFFPEFYLVLNGAEVLERLVLAWMHASHLPRAYIPGYKQISPTPLRKVCYTCHVCRLHVLHELDPFSTVSGIFIDTKSCYLKYFLTGGLFVYTNGISLEMFLDWRFGFLNNSIYRQAFQL